jgi:hypothetical protein
MGWGSHRAAAVGDTPRELLVARRLVRAREAALVVDTASRVVPAQHIHDTQCAAIVRLCALSMLYAERGRAWRVCENPSPMAWEGMTRMRVSPSAGAYAAICSSCLPGAPSRAMYFLIALL